MSGQSDQVAGRIKEAAGIVTGDKDLESEGAAQRQAGEIEETVEQAKESVASVVDAAKDSVSGIANSVKNVLPHN